jgi:hypothetical protein
MHLSPRIAGVELVHPSQWAENLSSENAQEVSVARAKDWVLMIKSAAPGPLRAFSPVAYG